VILRTGLRESPSWQGVWLRGRIRSRRLLTPDKVNTACRRGGPYVHVCPAYGPEDAMSRRRGQPYGADLRDRVLAAAGETIRVVAARFSVSPSSSRRSGRGYATPARRRLVRNTITFGRGWSRSMTGCVRGSPSRQTRRLPSCALGWRANTGSASVIRSCGRPCAGWA
jgi:hypothetical protein